MEFAFKSYGSILKFSTEDDCCDELNYINLNVSYSSDFMHASMGLCVNSLYLDEIANGDITKNRITLQDFDSQSEIIFDYGKLSQLKAKGTVFANENEEEKYVVRIMGKLCFVTEETESIKFSYFMVSKEDYDRFKQFIKNLIKK